MKTIVSPTNLGFICKNWFAKSIYNTTSIKFDENEIYSKALKIFITDFQRYFPYEENVLLEYLETTIPLQSILTYRIAHEYFLVNNEIVATLYSNLGRFLTGIEIFYSSNIGSGLKINHGVGTVIGARVKIGSNLLIHQNVTLGDRNGGRPIIHNNVCIYAGAKILGDISIGNNSIIGANAVVIKNVEENSTVVGIPANRIK